LGVRVLALAGLLALALAVILIAAQLFTNALEHVGDRLNISEGVTGSLFAAVGTALPETVVPLIAIFTRSVPAALGSEIGVGAILGAPLMLSSLTLALVGVGAIGRAKGPRLSPEFTGLRRDLNVFLAAFLIAALALFVPENLHLVRIALSAALCALYVFYVATTLKASSALVASGHGTRAESHLLISRIGIGSHLGSACVQASLALVLLVLGAHLFISGVSGSAALLGISPLLLSLLIIPVATELPEKINSIRWIRKGRDTLAFGNITGAMVFQGTLLPAVGILLTPWSPRADVLGGVMVTLAGALSLRLCANPGGFRSAWLGINGCLYAAYLISQFVLGPR
jgi:cation:H+ antiporter